MESIFVSGIAREVATKNVEWQAAPLDSKELPSVMPDSVCDGVQLWTTGLCIQIAARSPLVQTGQTESWRIFSRVVSSMKPMRWAASPTARFMSIDSTGVYCVDSTGSNLPAAFASRTKMMWVTSPTAEFMPIDSTWVCCGSNLPDALARLCVRYNDPSSYFDIGPFNVCSLARSLRKQEVNEAPTVRLPGV